MSRVNKFIVFAALVVGILAGCDRFVEKNEDPNQAPSVRFVNFPVDSSEFSYAPIIYWQGFDTDGFVTGFEFYDDISSEGIAAYHAGDAQFEAYLATIPSNVWTGTVNASQQIFLLTEVGQVTEHIFMVRSIDNGNARSPIVVRTFFRTNQAPDAPKIRWADSDTSAYFNTIVIPDTQLVGDTLTIVYNGIRLLWQGTDPDSRSANIIPLQFSYSLVNSRGDSIALPVRNDSNQVIGYHAGWSRWGNVSQISLFGLPTEDYRFNLRVRDDGFTVANSMATADFKVIKPTLARQLLIVDENKPPSAVEFQRGGVHADTFLAAYRGADGLGGFVRDAIDIANTLAPFAQPPGSPPIRHFDYDSIAWLDNRAGGRLSYDYVSQFDAVWVIDDDNASAVRTQAEVIAYNKVLSDYMDIGGSVMISGRRLFNKSQGLAAGNAGVNSFIRDYFNIFLVSPKQSFSTATPAVSGIPDFIGAVAGDPQWPDLEIDSTMLARLRYVNQPVPAFPEIETFGRSNAPVSFDFATTLYNYVSSTSDPELYPNFETNFDCMVDTLLSTDTTVALIPKDETLPLLSASRIYNRTRGTQGVYADFLNVRNVGTNILQPKWRIFATIPASEGRWQTSDTLEVTYRFIPLSSSHDEPCALNFIKYAGEFEIEINGNEITTRVTATPQFRSALFTFPLAYMKNDLYDHPFLGPVPALSMVLANEILFFNQNLDVNF